jgi:uncharacterized RDD family membrane protein YckC
MSTAEWYYLVEGQQMGPVGSRELKTLADRGRLQPSDLIWREGLPNWVPAARVKGLFVDTDVYGLDEEPAPLPAAPPAGAEEDEEFAPERVRRKKSREPRRGYAGFWKRFAAAFLDGIVLAFLGGAVGFVIGFGMGMAMGPNLDINQVQAVTFIAGLIVQWLYYASLESSEEQATWGKRALHIKVTDDSGQRISFGRASWRWLAKNLMVLTLGIGFLMAAFTPRKKALHDYMASTLVVND